MNPAVKAPAKLTGVRVVQDEPFGEIYIEALAGIEGVENGEDEEGGWSVRGTVQPWNSV